MGGLNAIQEILDLGVRGVLVKYDSPCFGANLSADRLAFPFHFGLLPSLFQRGHEEPVLFLFSGVEGCPSEGVVMVSETSIRVGRFLRIVRSSRVPQKDGGDLERRFIGVHDLLLYDLAGKEIIAGVRMPFAPGTE